MTIHFISKSRVKKSIYSLCLLLLSTTLPSLAQESRPIQTVLGEDIQSYLDKAANYGIIYSGKLEEPYYLTLKNHPYFRTDTFSSGTLCYNGIVYPDIMFRYDLYRDNIYVSHPQFLSNIELNKEKINWVITEDYKIIPSKGVNWRGAPDSHFLILLHDGAYPVIKTSRLSLLDKINNYSVEYSFSFKDRYHICINSICYPVKNKRSILKLFSDKKRELSQYLKTLDPILKTNPEIVYIELVKQYERLTR